MKSPAEIAFSEKTEEQLKSSHSCVLLPNPNHKIQSSHDERKQLDVVDVTIARCVEKRWGGRSNRGGSTNGFRPMDAARVISLGTGRGSDTQGKERDPKRN